MKAHRKIADLRILVTGASQGIGRAMCVEAARQGAKVLAAARTENILADLANEVVGATGGLLETVAADVTRGQDRVNMAAAAVAHFGGLDVLVNNAGIGATGHFADVGADRLRQIMEVNFFGMTETTRVCLPLLRQGRTPAIVNISSIAGRRGLPARSEYSASKFAVQGFSEALRRMARFGIEVFIINPGLTQTNFSQNMIEQKAKMQLDHLRGMTPEQVARATLRALTRGQEDLTLTWQGKMLILCNRLFPHFVDRVMKRKVRSLFREEMKSREAQLTAPALIAEKSASKEEHVTSVA